MVKARHHARHLDNEMKDRISALNDDYTELVERQIN